MLGPIDFLEDQDETPTLDLSHKTKKRADETAFSLAQPQSSQPFGDVNEQMEALALSPLLSLFLSPPSPPFPLPLSFFVPLPFR